MRLIFLTTLTMFAFAANSVLTRLALADGLIGPSGFAVLRVVSGAVMLAVLVWWRDRRLADFSEVSVMSVLGLSLYVLGFSWAYISLETGIGALILFGGVQITMFAGAILLGERPSRWRWVGAGVAFAGLIYLLAPSAGAPDPWGVILMSAAALGWGIYSLYGRTVSRPLAATAANFLVSAPLAVAAYFAFSDPVSPVFEGVVLAVVSGAITSGLGYALWYAVLPRIEASQVAIAQLSVPVLALGGGVLLLGEALNPEFVLASVLVLGGVLISLKK